MSDFDAFVPAYISRLSSILRRELGGNLDAWHDTVSSALNSAVERYVSTFKGRPLAGYNDWLRKERARVVRETFTLAGLEPPDADSAHDFAIDLQERGLRTCNHFFVGADIALGRLADSGYRLCFASSQESRYLRAATAGIASLPRFERFYGPDLIDCAKEGPEYYRGVFEDYRIDPGNAIVIDDQVACLKWAAAQGAAVIQARVRGNAEEQSFEMAFETWEDLPDLIESIAGTGNLTQGTGGTSCQSKPKN